MPVAEYSQNGQRVAVKNFMVPRRMDHVRYWYKAARKVIPSMPEYSEVIEASAEAEIMTIIFEWEEPHIHHLLMIARKRNVW